MSAHLVRENEIQYLIHAALKLPRHHSHLSWIWDRDHDAQTYKRESLKPAQYQKATRIGQMLWDENQRSLNARYEKDEQAPEFERRSITGKIDPRRVLAVIQNYRYQSCEHRGWESSQAAAFCRALEQCAIDRLTDDIDGWDAPEIVETRFATYWGDNERVKEYA